MSAKSPFPNVSFLNPVLSTPPKSASSASTPSLANRSARPSNPCAPFSRSSAITTKKMDGSGYPDGLRGDAIPLKARILQVADIYDALTTDRPYRGALPHNEALSILFAEADKGWLDSSVVFKFAEISKGHVYFPTRGRTMLASYYA